MAALKAARAQRLRTTSRRAPVARMQCLRASARVRLAGGIWRSAGRIPAGALVHAS